MERPIILKPHEVRGILEGRQTQVRRIVKPQPPEETGRVVCDHYNPAVVDRYGDLQPGPQIYGAFDDYGEWGAKCPYGQPDDRLWVRETWRNKSIDISTAEKPNNFLEGAGREFKVDAPDTDSRFRWQSPACMPRWASRLLLEIVSVRVERLQDISDEDAVAQGCKAVRDHCHVFAGSGYDKAGLCHGTPTIAFGCFWDDIHGQDSWSANPWVWVVEFKLVDA